MANKKISELPAATTPLAGTEEFEIVQGGINKRVAASNVGGGGTSIPFGTTASTNTYTIAATPAVTAYTDGMLLHVRVAASSTGLVTFNFDSVGAKKVLDTDGSQATDGYLKAGVDYIVTYNSALDSAVGAFTVVNEIQHGVMNLRGVFAASGGLYPGAGGSGPAGAIRHGDAWIVSGTDTIGSVVLRAGDFIFTGVDAPGQTASNWYVIPGYAAVDSKSPKFFTINVTDDVIPITTGTAKITFRMPFAMTLSSVRASLTVAQTSGSILTVDINEAGSTILSTKLTIDNTETTSVTAVAAPVISDTSLADNAVITIDVDQVGDGTATGLKVYFLS